MKIILDNLIFSWQKVGGISIFWGNLVEMVTTRFKPKDINIYEYATAKDNLTRKGLSLDSEFIQPLSIRGFIVKRYLNLSCKQQKEPFIFHSSYYRVCSNPKAINIITVHDFIYEYYVKGWKCKLHTFFKYRALRKADCIVCVSNNTKADLLKFLPNLTHKPIHIIYNGVSSSYDVLSEETIEKDCTLDLPNKFLLFVGGRTGYKNFTFATQVAKKMDTTLVIVGKPLSTSEEQDLQTRGVKYKSLFYLNEQELCYCYNKAVALLYPSEYEGFGIPLIEAQRCKCPVLAYKSSCIPEVLGNSPLLLKELDVTKACTLLERCMKENTFRTEIIEQGLKNSQRFSWDKMKEEYYQLYLSLIDKKE